LVRTKTLRSGKRCVEQIPQREHREGTWVMLGFVLTAIPSLTGPECVGSLLTLDPPINLRAYDQYENWFDTNSSMRLAQSGVYKGVNDIKEYVSFAFPGSPYIASRGTFRTDSGFVSFDAETRTCVVMTKVITSL
jgi:hypothetical protein